MNAQTKEERIYELKRMLDYNYHDRHRIIYSKDDGSDIDSEVLDDIMKHNMRIRAALFELTGEYKYATEEQIEEDLQRPHSLYLDYGETSLENINKLRNIKMKIINEHFSNCFTEPISIESVESSMVFEDLIKDLFSNYEDYLKNPRPVPPKYSIYDCPRPFLSDYAD